MEPLRKQLMARQPQWGDSLSPLQLSASQSGSDRENRGNPAPQAVDANSHRNSVEDLNAYDELIMADPKTRRKRTSAVKPQTLSCKDWTLESLVRQSKNFAEVPRIQWSPDISTSIRAHEANNKGVPLVVEGLHNNPRWIKDKFTPDWLERNGPKDISVRNMCDRSDKSIALPNFIARTRAISPFATPGESERLYGKDVPCPPEWNQFLHSGGVVPPFLSPDGPENLLNNLPKADQPETLMCYLGVGDTFTPCHKDLCASSGHNLMCYTENGGSSFWFMTATSSANAAAEYFTKNLKEQLDHETHVITVEQLAKAPFKVYVTEQKLGDLVLVPPRSSHQVVNAGGMTIKTSWSRITLDGLSLALRYELPLYRRVCRSEIYRIKSTIYHTLLQTIRTGSNLLGKQPKTNATPGSRNAIASTSQKDLPDTLLRLLLLFDSILIDEYSEETSSMQTLTPAVSQPSEMDAEDDAIGQLTCDFCGCDVFQSFFECRACVDGGTADPGAGFILCSGCYVEGRTCHCETMVPMQCRSFSELLETRSRALDLFTELESRPSNHVVVQIPFQERLENEMGLFRAALVLQKRRAKPQGNDQRRCTVRRSEAEQSHDSLNALLLPCKKCHSSTCLAHVAMDRRLHSAEAFLAHEKDVSHAVFHASHKASKRRFESELADLKREDLDQVFDVRVQLAYLATTFTTCRPINPNSQLWTAGYYDLHVWETDLPADQIPNEMSATETRKVVALQGVLKRPKRMVMDCVFMPPLSRPSKGKERQVAVTERSKPRDRVKFDDALDDLPPPKKPKRTHPPNRPPGSRTDSLNTMTKRSRPKTTVVVDSSSSEDERPPKRPRVVPRAGKPSKDLRFRKTGPQTAVSIADAFNNASAQNSKANSNTARPLPSTIPLTIPSTLPSSLPSSSAAPVLPRRYKRKVQVLPGPAQVPPGPVHVLPGPVHVLPGPVQVLPGPPGLASQSSPPETPHTATTSSSTTENPLTTVYPSPLATPALPRRQSKRKVVPAPTELASSSSSPAGPNSATTATTSSSTIENQLSTILETLSSVQATQVQHAAEVASMRERLFLGGNPPESISDAFAVLDRQSTGSTVKVVADLVNSLVSTLHQPANNMNNMSNYRTYPITRSGRGRGRGGLPFGDHSYRSTPPNNVFREFQQDHHRPYRPYHGGHYNSAPAGPARHTDTQDYYPGRVWIPGPYATQQGPYAAQHRRVSVSDEQGPRYHAFAEERREPREEARRGRRFTRFSPPESPENNTLDLVPARRRGSPSQRRPALFDRMETGSEGSVTVTNAEVANSEAGSMAMIRRQASTNTRRETPKFFATLRSVSPEDEQDWEAVYAKDTQS